MNTDFFVCSCKQFFCLFFIKYFKYHLHKQTQHNTIGVFAIFVVVVAQIMAITNTHTHTDILIAKSFIFGYKELQKVKKVKNLHFKNFVSQKILKQEKTFVVVRLSPIVRLWDLGLQAFCQVKIRKQECRKITSKYHKQTDIFQKQSNFVQDIPKRVNPLKKHNS